MGKTARLLSLLHRGVLAYMVLLAAPALLGVLLAGRWPGLAEGLATKAGNLALALWSFSAVYFCACLVLSPSFRERLLARAAGFAERDEREEVVTAKAARSVFLMTLGGLVAAGLAGMVRMNVYAFTRWKGGAVPPLVKVGPHELRRGEVERRGFIMWPSLGLPDARPARPRSAEREVGAAQYYVESGSLFGPEVPRLFFGLAAVQVLLFHLFARRLRA